MTPKSKGSTEDEDREQVMQSEEVKIRNVNGFNKQSLRKRKDKLNIYVVTPRYFHMTINFEFLNGCI